MLGLAQQFGMTPARLVLAWLLQHPAVVPIPGGCLPEHIEENCAAAQVVLEDDALAELDRRLAAVELVGATLL